MQGIVFTFDWRAVFLFGESKGKILRDFSDST